MKFTNEIIDQIDDNNMRAMEIIRTIMCLVECKELILDDINISILIDAAFDYLQKNDEIFNNVK